MEKNQVFEGIIKNLQELDVVQSDISMLELAIYQKKIENLKEEKLHEIRQYYEQQSQYFNQNSYDYQDEIDKNVEQYKVQIDKLINVYDKLYVRTFKIMQNSINNQKISISNIITLTRKIKEENLPEKDIQNYEKIINACAQKKLNYSVIINECKARIKWCIENVQKDIKDVFVGKTTELKVYKENVFNKIKEKILNLIFGKVRFQRVLDEYETEYIKSLKAKNNSRVLGVIIVIEGIEKQFEQVKEQISNIYNEATQS